MNLRLELWLKLKILILNFKNYALNAVPGAGIEPTRATHSGT
jgi:hypothetical protein